MALTSPLHLTEDDNAARGLWHPPFGSGMIRARNIRSRGRGTCMRIIMSVALAALLSACAQPAPEQPAGPAPLPAHPTPSVSQPAPLPPVSGKSAQASGCGAQESCVTR